MLIRAPRYTGSTERAFAAAHLPGELGLDPLERLEVPRWATRLAGPPRTRTCRLGVHVKHSVHVKQVNL